MPANSDALTNLPAGHASTDRIDDADYLVSWHARILMPGNAPVLVNESL